MPRKPLFVIIAVGIIVIFAGLAAFGLSVNKLSKAVPSPSVPSPTINPEKEADESAIKKEIERSEVEKFYYQGGINVREYALLEKIVDQNTFQAKLNSGKSVVFSQDPKTYIGEARFNFNQEREITNVGYFPLSKEEFLTRVSPGKRLAVRYLERDLTQGGLVKALELVILE